MTVTDDSLTADLYFDRNEIVEALKSRSYETKMIETPYEPKPAGKCARAC